MNSYIFHICFILFILLSYLIFDFVCLTLSSADTYAIAKYARTYIRDTHTQAHTQKNKKIKSRKIRGEKKREKGGRKKKEGKKGGKRGREMGLRHKRSVGTEVILITIDRHECFPVFHHLHKDKQRKQRHSLKLGEKRRKSSKRNYYIISPRVIINAIIIINPPAGSASKLGRLQDSFLGPTWLIGCPPPAY